MMNKVAHKSVYDPAELAQLSAEYAMMFENVSRLSDALNEEEVVTRLLNMVREIFAPRKVGYFCFDRKLAMPGISPENKLLIAHFEKTNQRYIFSALETGFLLRIDFRGQTYGILEIDDFQFPQYRDRYLNVMLNLAKVCGLAISNARQYREMARLDRMRVIGEMAAGIAHEIRNPMTTVLGFLQMFLYKPQLANYHETFKLMSSELLRANGIITEFLSLGKKEEFTPVYLDLNQLIESVEPLISSDALLQGKKVALDLADKLPRILIDPDEFRQLLFNITRNGLQAMGAGTLTIRTYFDQGQVVLAVRDQGSGMTKDVQQKIGTPFFTTKPDGTGLGLATCYTIAARHHAVLHFDTGSEGTTFYLRFSKLHG